MKLIYLHGLEDTPDNPLVAALKEQYQVIAPDISSDQKVAYAALTDLFISLKGEELIIVGTDMGGYWANYFANKHCLPALIINPTTDCSETVGEISDNVSFNTIKSYKIVILSKDNNLTVNQQQKQLFENVFQVEVLDNAENTKSNIEFIKDKLNFLNGLTALDSVQVDLVKDELRKSEHGMLAVLATKPDVNRFNLVVELLLEEMLSNQASVLVCDIEETLNSYHEALEEVDSLSSEHREYLKNKSIISSSEFTVSESCITEYDIENKITSLSKKHGDFKVVIIDSLQSINTKCLKSFLLKLKKVAKDYSVHILLLSKVNNAANNREYGRPNSNDIRPEVIEVAEITQFYFYRHYEADGFSLLRSRTIK
ncbi:MAG: hypothetical protein GX822_01420 [Alcaligenaceae bacterium]|nr:hypothetical protein [Alcaligenaceae bacterium]